MAKWTSIKIIQTVPILWQVWSKDSMFKDILHFWHPEVSGEITFGQFYFPANFHTWFFLTSYKITFWKRYFSHLEQQFKYFTTPVQCFMCPKMVPQQQESHYDEISMTAKCFTEHNQDWKITAQRLQLKSNKSPR